MTREQAAPITAIQAAAPAEGSVLRGVVLGGEARALARPGSGSTAGAARQAPAPQKPASWAPQAPAYRAQAQQRLDAGAHGLEAGREFKLGHDEGRQQGHAEGQQAGRAQGHKEGHAKGYQEGFDQGFEEGRKQGMQAGLEQGRLAAQQAAQEEHASGRQALAQRVRGLDALLTQLPGQIDRALADAEDEMLGLCFEVLAGMLGEAAASEEGVRGMVRQAIAQARSHEAARVHVNPRDLAFLQADEALAAWLGSSSRVQWVGDERVALGGCLVFTPDGGLDARLETQLARLAAAFAKVRREHVAPAGSEAS